jgi:hypothetical protein
VTELVELGYVERRPDPTDGRAKLIVLTERGNACIDAGESTIHGLEERITEVLGERGRRQSAPCWRNSSPKPDRRTGVLGQGSPREQVSG